METKARWYGPKQIGVMIFCGIIYLISSCVLGGQTNTVLPAIAPVRGWDVNVLTIFSGVANIILCVGALFFSAIIRKWGIRRTLGIPLFATAIALVIFGYTHNLIVFILMMWVIGFMAGGYGMAGVTSLIANWWPTKKGIALGWITMGMVMMGLVYVPVMPKAYAAIGIEKTQIVLAIVIAIVGIVGMFVIKPTPEEANTFPDGDPAFATDKADIIKAMTEYKSPYTTAKVLKNPTTWTVGLGFLLLYTAVMAFIGSAIPTFIGVGIDPATAQKIFMIGSVIAIIGSWLWGFIDDKIGTKKASVAFAIIIAISFVIALNIGKGASVAWILTIILMGCNGGLGNLIPSFVTAIYGRWDYAAGYKIIGPIAQLGGGIGIMSIGFFANPVKMYTFDLIIAIIAIVLFVFSKGKLIGKEN